MEVSAKFKLQGDFSAGTDLDLRLEDGRLARAELRWWVEPATADIEAASATAVISLGLWPFPVLEVDGSEIGPDKSQGSLHAPGSVSA